MTFFYLADCQKQCLTDCFAYFQYYRCSYNLTKISLLYDALYLIFAIVLFLMIWKGYDTQKRRMGYTRTKQGCCFKYLPPQQRAQEMRGPVEVQENYQLPQAQNQPTGTPTVVISPDLPMNTAPQF